jgi:hypothetical protein
METLPLEGINAALPEWFGLEGRNSFQGEWVVLKEKVQPLPARLLPHPLMCPVLHMTILLSTSLPYCDEAKGFLARQYHAFFHFQPQTVSQINLFPL